MSTVTIQPLPKGVLISELPPCPKDVCHLSFPRGFQGRKVESRGNRIPRHGRHSAVRASVVNDTEIEDFPSDDGRLSTKVVKSVSGDIV